MTNEAAYQMFANAAMEYELNAYHRTMTNWRLRNLVNCTCYVRPLEFRYLIEKHIYYNSARSRLNVSTMDFCVHERDEGHILQQSTLVSKHVIGR